MLQLDFSTKIAFFVNFKHFRNKKTCSDTNSTYSVTFIKTIVIILFDFLEKYLYGKQ